MKELIDSVFNDHQRLAERTVQEQHQAIADAITLVIQTFKQGNKILIFGNGGSAADAQHIAAEFTGRFVEKDRKGLPVIALTTDTSAMTSISNDYGYTELFARQIEALAKKGDLLIGISTSGNSKNVIQGLKQGHNLCERLALSGGDGGEMRHHCEQAIVVPSTITARIQEMHILIGHILCQAVDIEFSG